MAPSDRKLEAMKDASIMVEFRIRLPMKCDEHNIARMYSILEMSKNETGGGEGYEFVTNEPREERGIIGDGKETVRMQYTYKILHLKSKVPSFIRFLAPKGSLEVHEESWNAYPECVTSLSNPEYMKDNFAYTICTRHFDDDDGSQDNVFDIPADLMGKRKISTIDIADNSKISSRDTMPTMCVYKLIAVHFKWFGLQTKVEKVIEKASHRLFTNFFRRLHCWTDEWYGMTIDDIRKLEQETKTKLQELRMSGEVQGMVEK